MQDTVEINHLKFDISWCFEKYVITSSFDLLYNKKKGQKHAVIVKKY